MTHPERGENVTGTPLWWTPPPLPPTSLKFIEGIKYTFSVAPRLPSVASISIVFRFILLPSDLILGLYVRVESVRCGCTMLKCFKRTAAGGARRCCCSARKSDITRTATALSVSSPRYRSSYRGPGLPREIVFADIWAISLARLQHVTSIRSD